MCGELGKLLVSYLDQAAGSSRISRSPAKAATFLSPRTSSFRLPLWALPGVWYSQLSLASPERPLSTGDEAYCVEQERPTN
jgi:hypothetical protein